MQKVSRGKDEENSGEKGKIWGEKIGAFFQIYTDIRIASLHTIEVRWMDGDNPLSTRNVIDFAAINWKEAAILMGSFGFNTRGTSKPPRAC
jgi:hypothetical protein